MNAFIAGRQTSDNNAKGDKEVSTLKPFIRNQNLHPSVVKTDQGPSGNQNVLESLFPVIGIRIWRRMRSLEY
jgi:hypothetical protein